MLSKYKLNQLYFKDTQFANLMTRRIFNVLLIANPYDAFMLEDDGRIDEKIFNEYTSLSLRYPPRFSQVSTEEEALTQLENMSFDLVICMPSTGDNDSFDIGRHIKAYSYCHSDSFQPWYYKEDYQRRSECVRIRILLAG